MFDIGFWELFLISVVTLIVVGPDRLPSVMRRVLSSIRDVRTWLTRTQNEVEHQLRIQELHENLKKAEQLNANDLSPELKASVEELKNAASSVQNPFDGDKPHER